jgi:deazaflavin-dependent oxidoreductase (nitroreductase family)
MGVLTHTGRRTGASYDTPLIVFDRPGGWIVALPYGERADWVRNVLAAGAAGLHTRRHLVPVTDPKITNHRRHPGLPWLFRQTFAVTGVHTFLELTTAPDRPDR